MNPFLEDKEYREELLRIGYVVSLVNGNATMKNRITTEDVYNILSYNVMFDKERKEYEKRHKTIRKE